MTPRKKVLAGLAILATLAAVSWLAWPWLSRGYYEFRHGGETGHGGMNMNMPDMGGPATGAPGMAIVMISPELQQRVGVTIGRVEKAPLRMRVNTVAIIQPDETKLARVHIRTEGWVKKTFINYTGQAVRKGEPLLNIYSPQFLSTEVEYIAAIREGQTSLAALARQRLELWDVPAEEIDELKRTGKPRPYLTLRSPIAGTGPQPPIVLVRNAFPDQYVTPQKELYQIADLSDVWAQAKVYEYELPHVELGQPATITLPALPGRTLTGKVVFIEPVVQEPARTTNVRVQLPNQEGLLKPGMFAHITIEHPMGEGLLAPTSAVIRTGTRDLAFRADKDNRFVPVVVKIGPYQFGNRFQILSGLKAGDRVVTSADFLIDSESRLRFGGGGMMPGMNMGGGTKR